MKYAGKPTPAQRQSMRAKAQLEGKTIREVVYMPHGEDRAVLILRLHDGTDVHIDGVSGLAKHARRACVVLAEEDSK